MSVWFHVHMFHVVCYDTKWVQGALLSWRCRGRCPGSDGVIDGVGCHSIRQPPGLWN